MRKFIAIIIVAALGLFIAMTYGKWEYLTYAHSKKLSFQKKLFNSAYRNFVSTSW